MYQYTLLFRLLIVPMFAIPACTISASTWSVIGGGPAGIIAVSTLCDHGVDPDHIAWIDPSFTVGRLGAYYANVPANSPVKEFLHVLNNSETLNYYTQHIQRQLAQYPAEVCKPLSFITQPLAHVTRHLCKQVHAYQTHACQLDMSSSGWSILCADGSCIPTEQVILATGARPRTLDYGVEDAIPLDTALDKSTLAACVTPEDTVCVVGSSHSAVLILKYLTELSVKRIINLYKSPLTYAYDDGNTRISPASGLKGIAAQWAHDVLEHHPPDHLTRVYNDQEARETYLPACTKIIYAVGYERNPLPEGVGGTHVPYDDITGVIAPGLFGLGIAFPERACDSYGHPEYLVGLNSFQSFAQRQIPYWMTHPRPRVVSREGELSLIIDNW